MRSIQKEEENNLRTRRQDVPLPKERSDKTPPQLGRRKKILIELKKRE